MSDIDKIDEELLGTIVSQELDDAASWMDSDLAGEQAENLDYYYGEPFGNEEEGFSDIVTRDVLETVEGIMPELMKIFTSGDQVVEFDPVGPHDEAKVEIQGRYINHLFMNRFNGYKLLYDWFKDALLMKNGIIKVGWEDCEEVQFMTYSDLTEEEYNVLEAGESNDDELQGAVYEIDKAEEEDGKYKVRLKLTRQRGRPDICVVPSEDFRIKERSVSIKDAPFVAHCSEATIGELIELGFDEDEIESASPAIQNETVKEARFTQPEEGEVGTEEITGSSYERLVEVADCYIRLYDPEDEKTKLYNVFMIGDTCVDYCEVDRAPFISLAPIMMPHKHTGIAVADLVRDIQEIRSGIMRETLNNLRLQNAGRYTAVEGQVNLQDLIDNKIGGIVRQKMPDAVRRLDTPTLAPYTLQVMEGLDVQKENRTGVSRLTHGLDPSALNSHQTAGAVNQVMTAAQSKILLIARNFAETGVKDLFLELYNLIREHQTMPDMLPVEGRYAIVNPPEWTDRHDVHVTVGIGNGNKDQQLMHLTQISQLLMQIGQTEYGYMITDENVYNLASEFIKNSGYINPNKFISSPAQVEKPQPQPTPEMITAQADAKYKETLGQKGMGELKLDKEKFNWQQKVDATEATLEASQDRPVGLQSGK